MTNDPFTPDNDVRGRATEQAFDVRDHALREAGDVKDHASDAARDVAQTAGTEARAVARDAQRELRGLMDSSLNELNTQLGTGQSRLAEELRTVVAELGEMVQGSRHNGLATQAARELEDRGRGLAGWLDSHEPRDALTEVRRYAARNPWTFLALAAGAGLVVGRFARGLRDDNVDDDPTGRYDVRPAVGQGYAEPTPASAYAPGLAGTQPQGTGYPGTAGLAGAAGYPGGGQAEPGYAGTGGQAGTGYPGTGGQAGTGYPDSGQAGTGYPDRSNEGAYDPGVAGQRHEAQFGDGQFTDPGERR